jgi:hypothetical protein
VGKVNICWKNCLGVTHCENKGDREVHTENTGQVKLEVGTGLYLTGIWVKVKSELNCNRGSWFQVLLGDGNGGI